MLLAVDVGNSNIHFGIWDGEAWKYQKRVETHRVNDEKGFMGVLQQFTDENTIDASAIGSGIISSVVPKVNQPLSAAIDKVVGFRPVLLNAETDAGITLATEHPEQVGADLIADAAGAYELVNDTCLVVDFGTATTVMAVEKPGMLTGGAICAGLKVSIEALVGKTAQLQEIPLEIPPSPLGKNTVECMQSGLVLGHLCMVEGLIDRMKSELGAAKVVATGGLVSLLASQTQYFNYVEPMLTLNGLRRIAERQ